MIFTVPIHEFNKCHEPGGQPVGGRFCDDAAAGVVTLYRGDSKDLSTHALAKSDPSALFGAGIYLTNNRRIAGDYTAKGGETLFRYLSGKKGVKQDAIDAYIRQQARWVDAAGNRLDEPRLLHGYSYEKGSHPSAGIKQKADEDTARLAHARQQWATEIEPTVEVRRLTDGETVIRKKGETGTISTYAIPKEWVSKALDAEAEISQGVAVVMSNVLKTVNDGYRSSQADMIYRFATTPNEDGDLPSFRQVYQQASEMIGAGGYNFNEEAGQLALRRGLKALGYKGISYAGGVTLGGGVKHRAYVFWDEQGLKKHRKRAV